MGWKWLHHENENWGVVGISTVDAYSGINLYTAIFWVTLATRFHKGKKVDFKRFQNSKITHPLTKINMNKSCYVGM
jgi:hypothetical protein